MNNDTITSDLIKVTECARMIRKSRATVHNYIQRGDVFPEYAQPFTLGPHQRGYFFRRSAIERWLQECAEQNQVKPEDERTN